MRDPHRQESHESRQRPLPDRNRVNPSFMPHSQPSPAALEIVEWLGSVGPRWGFPRDACRVHGVLYLLARPVTAETLREVLILEQDSLDAALSWLSEEKLVVGTDGGWATQSDPWDLMTQALDSRRSRELPLALDALRDWHHERKNEDPTVASQATRLKELVEDIAAIDAGAQRLAPGTLRRIVGVGGRAARLLNRTLGTGGKKR